MLNLYIKFITGCYVDVPSLYHMRSSEIRDGFSVSAWVRPQPNVDGYILAKTSADGSRHYYALKIRTVDMDDFYSATIEFRYSAINNPVSGLDSSEKGVLGWRGVIFKHLYNIPYKIGFTGEECGVKSYFVYCCQLMYLFPKSVFFLITVHKDADFDLQFTRVLTLITVHKGADFDYSSQGC